MPPAAANRSAPSMEQHKIYLMSSQHIPQLKLCFLQCPVGHPVSPVFVAVGISEHDLLEVLSGLQLQGVDGVCQNDFHLACTALQILNGFKQGYHIDAGLHSALLHPPKSRSEEHTSELQSRGHLVC